VVTGLSKSIRTLSTIILIATLMVSTGSCSLALLQNADVSGSTPDPDSGAEKVLCSAAEVTLAWDAPPSEIATYKIFYRSHESGSWILFEEIPADDNPEYTLYYGDFGNGDYDFGVVAVDTETSESAMHTCLDDTAEPECGWYLSWVL
jgi:hypothetical protein